MRKISTPVLLILFLTVIQFSINPQPVHAANCDGLQLAGNIPTGTYTLTDNCVTLGTLTVLAGAIVTINGGGFAIDGNTAHSVFNVNAGATLNLNNVTVQNGGSVALGGGVFNAGTLTVANSAISGNTANNGGGIWNTGGGSSTITNSTISGNTADYGGGIYNNGATSTVITINSTISGHTVIAGGGIYNNGTLTITNSTIAGNSALTNAGGGIYNDGPTMMISNSTISGNTANDGGGVFSIGVANTVIITNSTISGNTATNGDAIRNISGSITITNSITTGTCENLVTLNDGGGNIAFNAVGCPGTNVDPMLGAFNGSYYSLLTGSPAIDSAPTCAGLTNDQIGTARPQGVACDIGAIEMPVDPVTGEVIPIANPGTPSLNQWNAEYQQETRAEAYGVQDNVYATIHMQNGAWQYNSGGIPQELIDYGVILAIDVWEFGDDQFFDHYEKVCLQGEGRLIFFDATQSPRPMVEITPVTFEDSYTCGWIPNAGTIVLIEPE